MTAIRAKMLAGLAGVALLAGACATTSGTATGGGPCTPAESPVITLAAYSTVYDTYGKLTTDFQTRWKEAHNGQQVIFQSSFGASTTQATNVANGFPADVVALSLPPDVDIIRKAGLITHDWTTDTNGGIVSNTVVVLDVHQGNPKGIHDWADLVRPGLQILTPDPSQSGGAKWNILAAYGAALRGKIPGYVAGSQADAERFLQALFANVTVMDKSANDSLKNFQAGNGDVAITYENQVAAGVKAGKGDTLVEPSSTVLIENPAVVVDKNAQAHCVAPVAKAFVQYLHSADAQEIFASVGSFRPADPAAAPGAVADLDLPALSDVFRVSDLGGWDKVLDDTVFGPNGAFTTALQKAKG